VPKASSDVVVTSHHPSVEGSTALLLQNVRHRRRKIEAKLLDFTHCVSVFTFTIYVLLRIKSIIIV
jgi:hypothetical protein